MKRFALALGIVLAAALWAVVDPNAGVRSWWDAARPARARRRRAPRASAAELAALEAEAERLEHDPLAVEAAIRADLGLARPGEIVVRAVRREAANP